MTESTAVSTDTAAAPAARPRSTALVPYRPRERHELARDLNRVVRKPSRLGFMLILVFVGGFGVWASTAPLAGGAVAPATVSPDSGVKTVQHFEGGIVRSLLVREGDEVAAGQNLLELESVQARASFDRLRHRQHALMATEARLEAEAAGAAEIVFPETLPLSDPEVARMAAAQERLFDTRARRLHARRAVLEQRMAQLRDSIRGYDAQRASAVEQLSLIDREIAAKDRLVRQGLLPLPILLELQRLRASVFGRKGEAEAEIARAETEIGQAELERISLEADRADEIAAELEQVRRETAEVREQLTAAEDVLSRTMIKAPVDGVVTNLRLQTIGGVLASGEPILDIVPNNETLIIEARVSPMDVDVVHVGLEAQIRLSAYGSASVQPVSGVVLSVSADRLIDDATQGPYYLARIEVDRTSLAAMGPGVELVPGMPADVLIVTGERTLLQYIIEPFMDAFDRSFREV